MRAEVIHGDCLSVMRTMPAASVDAVITDPPYGLKFMGKLWDHGVPGEQFWDEALRVAKPGAALLAFGGTRTFHRLACAIEDSGWRIYDCLSWMYGQGFPKHRTHLKPAWEPIVFAAKKGARFVNVEGCRVGVDPGYHYDRKGGTAFAQGRGPSVEVSATSSASGRWPANVILDEEAGALLDEQSGVRTTGRLSPHHGNGALPRKDAGGFRQGTQVNREYGGDSGGASRFFYCPKASRSERNAGCEGLEGKVYAPSGGAQSAAARGEGYDEGQGIGLNRVSLRQNHHPTVKPVALMRWLVRLIAPPGGLVLDPFMGSGTTGVACMQEGREFIGVECEPEYIAIAEARISHSLALQTQLVV